MKWIAERLQNIAAQIQKRIVGWVANLKSSVILLFFEAIDMHYHHLNLGELSLRELDNLIRYALLRQNHHDIARKALRKMETKAEGWSEENICNLSKLSLLLSEKHRYKEDFAALDWEILQTAEALQEGLRERNVDVGVVRKNEIENLLDQIEQHYEHIASISKKREGHRTFTSVG